MHELVNSNLFVLTVEIVESWSFFEYLRKEIPLKLEVIQKSRIITFLQGCELNVEIFS